MTAKDEANSKVCRYTNGGLTVLYEVPTPGWVMFETVHGRLECRLNERGELEIMGAVGQDVAVYPHAANRIVVGLRP